MEDPGVHHLTVNLHHYFIILPIDHVICRGVDTGFIRVFRVGAVTTLQGYRVLSVSTPVCQYVLPFPPFISPRVFTGSVRAVPFPPRVEPDTQTTEEEEETLSSQQGGNAKALMSSIHHILCCSKRTFKDVSHFKPQRDRTREQ